MTALPEYLADVLPFKRLSRSDPALAAIHDQVAALVDGGMKDAVRIAALVVERLEADALRVAAVHGIAQIVRERHKGLRGEGWGGHREPVPAAPSRWDALGAVEVPVNVGPNTWATVETLTPDQLDELAKRFLAKAARATRTSKAFTRLAFELRRLNLATVGDLPRSIVVQVFTDLGLPVPAGAA